MDYSFNWYSLTFVTIVTIIIKRYYFIEVVKAKTTFIAIVTTINVTVKIIIIPLITTIIYATIQLIISTTIQSVAFYL